MERYNLRGNFLPNFVWRLVVLIRLFFGDLGVKLEYGELAGWSQHNLLG